MAHDPMTLKMESDRRMAAMDAAIREAMAPFLADPRQDDPATFDPVLAVAVFAELGAVALKSAAAALASCPGVTKDKYLMVAGHAWDSTVSELRDIATSKGFTGATYDGATASSRKVEG